MTAQRTSPYSLISERVKNITQQQCKEMLGPDMPFPIIRHFKTVSDSHVDVLPIVTLLEKSIPRGLI